MTATELLHELHDEGLQLALTERGTIKIAGAPDALDKWTPAIRKHKPELIDLLRSWADLETPKNEGGRPSAKPVGSDDKLPVTDAEIAFEASYGRVTCLRCSRLSQSGVCRARSTPGTNYTPLQYEPVLLWRRCEEYKPA